MGKENSNKKKKSSRTEYFRQRRSRKKQELLDGFDIFDTSVNLTFPYFTPQEPSLQFFNLTGRALSPTIEKFLCLELNFALPSAMLSDEASKEELDAFKRKIRLKFHPFNTTLDNSNDFYIKTDSTFQPDSGPTDIEDFLWVCSDRLNKSLSKKPYKHIHQHHTIIKCINSLKNTTSIIITPADKNLGTVIMNRAAYEEEALKQLYDKSTYTILCTPPSIPSIFVTLENIIRRHRNNVDIPSDYLLQLKNKSPQLAHLYILPKVHKTLTKPPGRPICSQTNTATYYASKYIDVKLQPFIRRIPSYIDDPIHLINHLNTTVFPQTTVIMTADIASLYPNIDHQDGMQKMRQFLFLPEFQDIMSPDDKCFILALLQFVLTNNLFTFSNLYFHQIKGTAMGTPAAVAYATIYVYMLERNAILISLRYNTFKPPLLYKRFIDDILGVFLDDISVSIFITSFNAQHPSIQLPVSEIQRGNNVHFLDLYIYRPTLSPTYLISIYHKPTSTFQYLHPQSNHAQHIFKSFIVSELNRILLRSSDPINFLISKYQFYKHLLARTYTTATLDILFNTHSPYISTQLFESINPEFITKSPHDTTLYTLLPHNLLLPLQHAEHLHQRNSLIQFRLSNKRIQDNNPPTHPIIYKSKISTPRFNIKDIIQLPKFPLSTDILDLYSPRPPVICSHTYNKIKSHISINRYKTPIPVDPYRLLNLDRNSFRRPPL